MSECMSPPAAERQRSWARFLAWQRAEASDFLAQVRERVLSHAAIECGERVLDIGAGLGLLSWGALIRVGLEGQVIALDCEAECLAEVAEQARDQGVDGQILSLRCNALLLPLVENSVDVCLTRSVLIYMADKAAAAREMYRVLRPGGRVSCFEPINRRHRRFYEQLDLTPLGDELAQRIVAAEEALYASDDTMVNFDEHDLVAAFRNAGFVGVELVLEEAVHERTLSATEARELLDIPGAAKRPTFRQRLASYLTAEEIESFRALLAEQLAGRAFSLCAPVAYGWGRKACKP